MRIGFGLGLKGRVAATVTAPPSIASLYGTGLGQVPLHLDPATAVLDGNGNVVSVPNSGGAGATFNAETFGTGAGMTISGGRFVTTSTTRCLLLATPADLVGARVFFVSRLAPEAVGAAPRFAGRNGAATDGERTEIHLTLANNAFAFRRHNGTAMPILGNVSIPSDTGAALLLYEIEIIAGEARVFVNGASAGSASLGVPDFRIDRLFGGANSPYFTGQAGDIVSLIVDGNQSAQIATIRQALAAKHGLTLA